MIPAMQAGVQPGIPVQPPVNPHSLINFDRFREEFDRIQPTAVGKLQDAEANRKVRRSYVDVEQLRSEQKIPANATYIPVRLIDKNIERDMPQFIAYLTQAPRLVTLVPETAAARTVEASKDFLEKEITRVLKYEGWAEAHIRAIDGAQLNGWSWYEVVFDPTKAGHVRIECVNYDELIFDVDVTSIQHSRLVARAYKCSLVHFDTLSSQYKFDESAARELREKLKTSSITIYHTFFKEEGVVHSGWYCTDLQRWLREPKQFFNGVVHQELEEVIDEMSFEVLTKPKIVEDAEKDYPYFLLPYRVVEDRSIKSVEGRATLDYASQDAATSLMSALVNGCISASNTMWAPDENNPDAAGAAPRQSDMVIKQNAVWTKPMRAFNSPWPDSSLFRAVEMVRSQNAADNAQVDFAVTNRKDSRKTATEIQAAAQQQSMLSGTTLFIFSNVLRSVFNAAWRIMKSRALYNGLPLAQKDDGSVNVELLSADFTLLPAGDVDYVQRQERITAMQQDLPMVMGTPLQVVFMKEYFRIRYPELADRFTSVMDQQQANDTALIAQLGQLLQLAVQDENGQLNPQFQAYASQLGQLQQQVAQRLGAGAPAAGQAGVAQ